MKNAFEWNSSKAYYCRNAIGNTIVGSDGAFFYLPRGYW